MGRYSIKDDIIWHFPKTLQTHMSCWRKETIRAEERDGSNWQRSPKAFSEGHTMTWYSTSPVPRAATRSPSQQIFKKRWDDPPGRFSMSCMISKTITAVNHKHACGHVSEREKSGWLRIESIPKDLWTFGGCYLAIHRLSHSATSSHVWLLFKN